MRKFWIAVIVLLVVVIGAAFAMQATKGDGFSFGSKKDSDEDKLSYFEPATRKDIKLTVEATGTTEPIVDIDIKSEATGRITELYVQEGDEITAGDLICKLDQSNQELVVKAAGIRLQQAKVALEEANKAASTTQLSALENAVTSAELALSNAKKEETTAGENHDRIKELFEKGYARKDEIEAAEQRLTNAENAVRSAESNLTNARVQLDAFKEQSDSTAKKQAQLSYDAAKVSYDEAQKQLGDSVIKAPIDGIILEKLLDVGDSVTSINSSFGGGDTIVRVADLSLIQVRTMVDEIDIGKIKIGQTASISVDAFPDQDFQGKVTNIFPQGVQAGTGVISFPVLIEVDNSEGLLRGNMTASVSIETLTLENVLTIPLSATRAGDEPDTTIVYVLKDGEDQYESKAETEDKEIEVGDTDYYDIVVTEGLEEGDLVKVRGFSTSINFS